MGKKRKKAAQGGGEKRQKTQLLNKVNNEGKGRTHFLNKLKCINQKAKQFIVGCNAVLRALEKNQLDFVAISTNTSSLLCRPINMLCAHHGVTLMSLEPQEFSRLDLKINKITAFGIKKTTVNEVPDLKELIEEAEIKNTHFAKPKP